MAEYIERQAAIDALDGVFDNVPMQLTTEILRLRRELRGLSPADVVPVVHGRWIDADFCGQYECSECGNNAVDLYDFCPNCGAKMDGKKRK